MKMTAAVLTQCGAPRPFSESRPVEIMEVELDPPGPGEVLVRIGGAGLCHSDLSLLNGDRPRPVPMVLGHEGSGICVEVGPGVNDIAPDDHIVFQFGSACGRCRRCLEGRPQVCETAARTKGHGQLMSGETRLSLDGSPIAHHSGVSCMAEYAVVDRGTCVRGRQEDRHRRCGPVRVCRDDGCRRRDQHRARACRRQRGGHRPRRGGAERPSRREACRRGTDHRGRPRGFETRLGAPIGSHAYGQCARGGSRRPDPGSVERGRRLRGRAGGGR